MSLNGQYNIVWTLHFLKVADENFVICFLVVKELNSIVVAV